MIISDDIIYKSKIMNQLIDIEDIYTWIDNPDITSPDDMKNVNIFSRMRIPNTALQVKNYICFDFNSRKLSRNEDLKTIFFNVAIICEETTIDTDYGNRHDLIAGFIIDNFTWSNFLGFELKLESDIESILQEKYYVRTLQFSNLAPNSLSNGVKMDGY